MRVAAKIRTCVVVLAAMCATPPAIAERMTDFDLNKLDGWTDALAVCDVTRFILTEPNVNADVIVVGGKGNSHLVLYKPLFMPPNGFFSEIMRQAFERVHKAGLTNPELYGQARRRYAGLMLSAYSSASLADKRYLLDQMELCYHLAARAGVKLDMKR